MLYDECSPLQYVKWTRFHQITLTRNIIIQPTCTEGNLYSIAISIPQKLSPTHLQLIAHGYCIYIYKYIETSISTLRKMSYFHIINEKTIAKAVVKTIVWGRHCGAKLHWFGAYNVVWQWLNDYLHSVFAVIDLYVTPRQWMAGFIGMKEFFLQVFRLRIYSYNRIRTKCASIWMK